MHVLLINCHSTTDESNKVWKEFERLVRKCFSHMIEMMHFAVRNMNELSEYFDKVDFIFIDGDKSFKPWAPSSKPLVTLLKMCCQVGFKCVFGTAPLITSLCFVIATGGKDTKIKGKGGSVASLQQVSLTTRYLNNRTGDAYQLVVTDTCHIWKPVVNVGLKVHVPPHPQSDIPRSVGESLMKKSKTCLHHWAFAGVPDQFVVPTASHFWDVADIPEWNGIPNKNSTNNNNNKRDATPHKDYGCSSLTILADMECGPAILEYDSIMAVHFSITEIYSHTVHILQNYISTKLDIMMNFGNQTYPSHRLYRKLTAVGNFSKFEERSKPIASAARTQPFPDPLLPLSSTSITPKLKPSVSLSSSITTTTKTRTSLSLTPSLASTPSSAQSPSSTLLLPAPFPPSPTSFPSSPTTFPLSLTSFPPSPTSFPPSPTPFPPSPTSFNRHSKKSDFMKKSMPEKDKEKDYVSFPVVRVPPTNKSPAPPRKRLWHPTPDPSIMYD